ncbi:transcriptional regulator, HxlR family [Aneurinibacillus aneurinilyticus ATCC 12856]|jgi:DNA-binding HxlR family transcriptional regulator|uniref:Transcriptional regulator, HxlR family n=1 Tax=Aneurinibacillus aneurinilyticus ATCC 12856 TaxID=649747 RepID=U1X7E9_ANEAE|nr:transcriptional regulator, HxlR family [Aneurinibacillus aneurinilyticus ATCC 12856]
MGNLCEHEEKLILLFVSLLIRDRIEMEVCVVDYSRMCPKYESAIELLGKKWSGLIIRVLLGGPRRFKDIKAQIPEMSDRMLTERIKEFEEAGILNRKVYPETPVRIEYELTDKGRALERVIESIQHWGETWM